MGIGDLEPLSVGNQRPASFGGRVRSPGRIRNVSADQVAVDKTGDPERVFSTVSRPSCVAAPGIRRRPIPWRPGVVRYSPWPALSRPAHVAGGRKVEPQLEGVDPRVRLRSMGPAQPSPTHDLALIRCPGAAVCVSSWMGSRRAVRRCRCSCWAPTSRGRCFRGAIMSTWRRPPSCHGSRVIVAVSVWRILSRRPACLHRHNLQVTTAREAAERAAGQV